MTFNLINTIKVIRVPTLAVWMDEEERYDF
jgi:hypothetical protein